MGFASRGITSADVLAAITDDDTRFSGADIPLIKDKIHGFMDFWGDPLNFPLELETLAMAGVCVVAAAVFRARRSSV